VVEGENAVEGERVGGNFTVKELGEVAVERTVRATEDFVSKLEIGNEDPCVEWDNSLQRERERESKTLERDMMGRLRFPLLLFFLEVKQN